MRKSRFVVIVLLVAAAVGGFVWWRGERGDQPAATAATARTAATAGSAIAARPAAIEPAPASLAVTVRDERGPLAGAVVRIAPDGGEVVLVRTGGDGVAHADRLAPGGYAISASAPDHQPAAAAERKLAAGERATLELRLAAGGRSLTGLVTDVNGGPIAGARIDAARLGTGASPEAAVASTLTGGDGRYRLTVAEGQLLVAARSPDYAPQSRYVEVGPAGATADFALVPGGVIEGVVRDERSLQPVPGARVVARRDAAAILLAETGARRATAGPDGKFRLTGLPPGVYELAASLDALRAKSPTVIGLGVAEQVADVEILIGVGPVIRGTVVDEAGAPVAGARVNALGRGTRDSGSRSDASGAFTLTGLAPGRYTLTARGDHHLPARGGAEVELADQDITGVVVRVRRGLMVRGHVEPRQVADVRVDHEGELRGMMAMSPSSITTGADGAFELGPLDPGPARLIARCASGDQGAAEARIADGMAEVVIAVGPGASIAGRVIDGAGKPVAGATVMASAQDGAATTIVNGRITSGVQGVTGATGAFELRGLSPGSYQLSVLERGRPLRLRRDPPRVALAAAERRTGIELAVDRPDGVINGVVTGPDGKPLADAWVSVHQDLMSMIEGGRPRGDRPPDSGRGMMMVMMEDRDDGSGGGGASDFPPALTDAQGRFAITGLPHAQFDVIAEAQAGALRGRAENVTPDATLTIAALGVSSLSGTVTGPRGPPALFAVELDGPTREQRSFTGGAFSLGRVDPGSYTVRVTSRDGNGEARVVVEPNRPATVAITLAANAVVVGSLVDPGGKPVAGMPVALVHDNGDGRIEVRLEGPPPTSGPDGRFRIERKAGLAALVVMVGRSPVIRRGLALEAGQTLDVGAVRVEPPAPPAP